MAESDQSMARMLDGSGHGSAALLRFIIQEHENYQAQRLVPSAILGCRTKLFGFLRTCRDEFRSFLAIRNSRVLFPAFLSAVHLSWAALAISDAEPITAAAENK